jgi:hypothetical protein
MTYMSLVYSITMQTSEVHSSQPAIAKSCCELELVFMLLPVTVLCDLVSVQYVTNLHRAR